VLNLTLKSPPVPKRSVTEPTLLETGAEVATCLEAVVAPVLEDLDVELLEDPETAELTVWDKSGEISATT